ncbi:MAG: hypothetical protein ACHQ7N_12700 [Candidatus Methylomirabilales bacterium]
MALAQQVHRGGDPFGVAEEVLNLPFHPTQLARRPLPQLTTRSRAFDCRGTILFAIAAGALWFFVADRII